MVLKLARNAALAKLAWTYVQRKRAETRRARTMKRTWTMLGLGAAAGALYVARKPILSAVRGLFAGLQGEQESAAMIPGGVLPLPIPPVSKKKLAKEARRDAAVEAERSSAAGPKIVHVERDAAETLAVPLREAAKERDLKQ